MCSSHAASEKQLDTTARSLEKSMEILNLFLKSNKYLHLILTQKLYTKNLKIISVYLKVLSHEISLFIFFIYINHLCVKINCKCK
jgi:hypothetical protein